MVGMCHLGMTFSVSGTPGMATMPPLTKPRFCSCKRYNFAPLMYHMLPPPPVIATPWSKLQQA